MNTTSLVYEDVSKVAVLESISLTKQPHHQYLK